MFAILASPHHFHSSQGYYPAPSSYERYQAALRDAEVAKQDYLRDLEQRSYMGYGYRLTSPVSNRYRDYHRAPVYPSETLFFEEQLRRRQAAQRLERARRQQLVRHLQDELFTVLSLAEAQEQYNPDVINHCGLRRHPQIRRAPQQAQPTWVNAQTAPTNGPSNLEAMLNSLFREQSQYSPPQGAAKVRVGSEQRGKQVSQSEQLPLPVKIPNKESSSTPSPSQFPLKPHASDAQAKPFSPASQSATQPAFDFGDLLTNLWGMYSEYQQNIAVSSTKSASSASASSSSPPPIPSADAAPASDAKETSLKAALEARLNNEHEAEIRDTIQAIYESLKEPQPLPSTENAETSAEGKGKGKAAPIEEKPTAKEPSPYDVSRAMDTLTNIEASFRALMEDFDPKTLSNLVFTAPPSYIVDDEQSDSTTDSTSRLAFTSRNGPVRFYIHSLNGILEQLDAVESYGSEELRRLRKEIVRHVEAALEDIENEVGVRLRMHERKEVPSKLKTSNEVASTTEAAPSSSVDAVPPQVTIAEEAPTTVEDSSFPITLTSEEQVATPVTPIPPVSLLEVPVSEAQTTDTVDTSLLNSAIYDGETLSSPPLDTVAPHIDSPVDEVSVEDPSPNNPPVSSSSSPNPQIIDLEFSESGTPQEVVSTTGEQVEAASESDPSAPDDKGFQPFLSTAFSESEREPQSETRVLATLSDEDVEVIEDVHSDWSEVNSDA